MIESTPEDKPSICFIALYALPLLRGDADVPIVGGAELQQVMLARKFAAEGYRVSMVCLDFGQEDEIEIDGIRVLRGYRETAGIPVLRFWYPRLTTIWRCLKKANADIYYQRAASILTGVMAAFCKRYGKASIFAAAGNPNFERNTSRIRFRRDKWIYEYGLRNVDVIFVQNPEQKALCLKNFGRDGMLVPNVYEGGSEVSRSGSNLILWVSTIRPLKQPHLFLDLAERLPDLTFRMIGGAGSSATEKALYGEVEKRAAMIPNLDFMGFVPYDDIGRQFEEAAVVVNTSESEGFPNAFLQAWAVGVPTVSFVDCGARVHGRPVGHVVSSVTEMAQVLEGLLSDSELRQSEAELCRTFVTDQHSWDNVLPLYRSVFSELAARTAGDSSKSREYSG